MSQNQWGGCNVIVTFIQQQMSYYYHYSQPIKSSLAKLKLCPIWNIIFISWYRIRIYYFNITSINSTGKKSRCFCFLFFLIHMIKKSILELYHFWSGDILGTATFIHLLLPNVLRTAFYRSARWLSALGPP